MHQNANLWNSMDIYGIRRLHSVAFSELNSVDACGRHGATCATFRWTLWCWSRWSRWSPQLAGLHQSGCDAIAAIAVAPRGGGSTCCADLRGQAAVDCRPEPQDAPGCPRMPQETGPQLKGKGRRWRRSQKISKESWKILKNVESFNSFHFCVGLTGLTSGLINLFPSRPWHVPGVWQGRDQVGSLRFGADILQDHGTHVGLIWFDGFEFWDIPEYPWMSWISGIDVRFLVWISFSPNPWFSWNLRQVTTALECGYRVIDTAQRYGGSVWIEPEEVPSRIDPIFTNSLTSWGNEEGIGRALSAAFAEGRVKRDEVFVTTKAGTAISGQDDSCQHDRWYLAGVAC